jgi:hypothetical protein
MRDLDQTVYGLKRRWNFTQFEFSQSLTPAVLPAAEGTDMCSYTIAPGDLISSWNGPAPANIEYGIQYIASGPTAAGSNRTLNWRFLLNGSSIFQSSASATQNQSWSARFRFFPVVSGDVISFRGWESTGNCTLNRQSLVIYPTRFLPLNRTFPTLIEANHQMFSWSIGSVQINNLNASQYTNPLIPTTTAANSNNTPGLVRFIVPANALSSFTSGLFRNAIIDAGNASALDSNSSVNTPRYFTGICPVSIQITDLLSLP